MHFNFFDNYLLFYSISSFRISYVSVVGATISLATSRAGASPDLIYIIHNNPCTMQINIINSATCDCNASDNMIFIIGNLHSSPAVQVG